MQADGFTVRFTTESSEPNLTCSAQFKLGLETVSYEWYQLSLLSVTTVRSPGSSAQAPVVAVKKDKKEKHKDETPEERAARKLAKKLKKEAKKARDGGERPIVGGPISQ